LQRIGYMNTITITTTQNIELEYELASLGDRIVGAIIDWVVIIAYIIVIGVTMSVTHARPGNFMYLMIILLLPIFFYDLASELLLNGQSLGKKVMGIRVISLSGQQPSFSQYLNRWIFRLIDMTLTSNMLAVILVAATEKKQRLGDIIAGTVVVKIKPRTTVDDTLYQPTEAAAYAVTYPEVINLKDADVQLIKEVLITVHRTGNTMISLEAQRKIEQVLNITSRHDDSRVFLRVVLADYNYLSSQM
jgi:uncharacterized RDD family membrane protein YckC